MGVNPGLQFPFYDQVESKLGANNDIQTLGPIPSGCSIAGCIRPGKGRGL